MLNRMRFSLLSLNLGVPPGSLEDDGYDQLVRYVAERNITCMAVQGCRGSGAAAASGAGSSDQRVVETLHGRLASLGLKYNPAPADAEGVPDSDSGVAVLSQLPVLASLIRGLLGPGSRSSAAVMVRLAVAPGISVDVYSLDLGRDPGGRISRVEELIRFVTETPTLIELNRPPDPPRRGRRPRPPAPQDRPPQTRLVCLAGTFGEEPEGPVRRKLGVSGFLDLTSHLRDRGETATTAGGLFADYVYLKPAIRAQAVELVFTGVDRPRLADHSGVLVEFEV